MRVIPSAAATGQAAGMAAAICAKDNIPVKEANVGEMQRRLAREGGRIHLAR
ncbi:MAG: FAD-dependent oxidoreductase [Bacillota bacterium]